MRAVVPVDDLADADLAVKAAEGNNRAFEELHNRYQAKLHSFLAARLPDPSITEDVAQEVWVRVVRHLENFDPERAKFQSWLLTIASNLTKNAVRDASRNRILPLEDQREDPEADRDPLEQTEDPRQGAEDRQRRREMLRTLRAAWHRLSQGQRIVVRRRFVKGMNYEEIAHTTGIKPGTVKSRLHRARKVMREEIGAAVPGGGEYITDRPGPKMPKRGTT